MVDKVAAQLKKGEKVLVMGIEYVIEEVEPDDEADFDVWLQPTDPTSNFFITMNMSPHTPVQTIHQE